VILLPHDTCMHKRGLCRRAVSVRHVRVLCRNRYGHSCYGMRIGNYTKLSNGTICNDVEWLSEIFNDTMRRATSLRQLSLWSVSSLSRLHLQVTCFIQNDVFSFDNFVFAFAVVHFKTTLPRDAMHNRGLCRQAVSVCVCLSGTFVDCVKTNKDIFKMFPPSGSQAILVFPYQTAWQYSDSNPLTGASNADWVGRNCDS